MRHLRVYRAIRLIAQVGSIRKAAERLAISPSALNRTIQGFEDELGAPVFDRVAGGVRLSAAGELLIRVVANHLTEMEDFAGLLSDMSGEGTGTLRLTISSDLSTGLVPDALAAFQNRHARANLQVTIADDAGALTEGRADLAILTHPATDQGLEVLLGQSCPLIGIATGFGELGQPAGPWDLADCRMIVPPEGTGTRIAVDHLFRRLNQSPAVMTEAPPLIPGPTGDVPAMRILPQVSAPAAQGGEVHLDLGLGSVQISILRRTNILLPRIAQSLILILQERLDDPPAPFGSTRA